MKINETPFSLGSLHSIFHTLYPQTSHDNVSISRSEDVDPTSSGISQCGKISQLQTNGDSLKVKTGPNETGADLNIQNAEKASLIPQEGEETPIGSIEPVCSTEITQSGSNIPLRMTSQIEENETQPLPTPMQHPSGGYIQKSNVDRVTALPMPGISMNSPALQQENTSGENQSKTNVRMNCISGDYVPDANNGRNGACIGDVMKVGLAASGNMELGTLDLEGETNNDISLSMLDNIATDHFNIHSCTNPMQNSRQGYLQESDTATFSVQPCLGNHNTQIPMDNPCKGDNPSQHSSNMGVQNSHQPPEDMCTESFTSVNILQGDHRLFKVKPLKLRSGEDEFAVCEVPLSTLEFTKAGADGYIQESSGKMPHSLHAGTNHDPQRKYETTTSMYSAVPPLASTMQHPSLDCVQDSNTERISLNSPAIHQAQENTSEENQSKMELQINCQSGDYVCNATKI